MSDTTTQVVMKPLSEMTLIELSEAYAELYTELYSNQADMSWLNRRCECEAAHVNAGEAYVCGGCELKAARYEKLDWLEALAGEYKSRLAAATPQERAELETYTKHQMGE